MRAAQSIHELLSVDRHQICWILLAYHLARETSPLIYGHYPFSTKVYDRFKGRWNFVTILRDPVDRWYSHYFYNRYKDIGRVGKTELDIEEYIESDQGRANARSFVNYLIEVENPYEKATEREAEFALQAAQCFDVCGRLEDIAGFRNDMKRRFGRSPTVLHFNRNPAPSHKRIRPDSQSTIHRRLLELLEADRYIYESLFER